MATVPTVHLVGCLCGVLLAPPHLRPPSFLLGLALAVLVSFVSGVRGFEVAGAMDGGVEHAEAWLASDAERLALWGVFTRVIALVYLISFLSLSTQVKDLAGSKGLNPITPALNQYSRVFFPAMRRGFFHKCAHAVQRMWSYPTLFWFCSSDMALVGATHLGATVSLLLLVGGWGWCATSCMWALLWALYKSLDVPIGLAYPWDSLLFSLGALAVALPPVRSGVPLVGWLLGFAPASASASSSSSASPLASLQAVALPHHTLAFAVRWLFVRLLVGFGKLKFMGTDDRHHCYIRGFCISQPMPTKFGWFLHHAPLALHKLSLAVMFIVEIILPPLAFFAGAPRQVAAASAAVLMLGIQLTGNFGYFNILTAGMCVAVMDPVSAFDWSVLRSDVADVTAGLWAGFTGDEAALAAAATTRGHVLTVAAAPYLFATLWFFIFNSWVNLSWLQWPTVAAAKGGWATTMRFLATVSRLRLANAFGVFPPASAPPLRWVVLMEGSADGATWREYHWKFMTSGRGASIAAAPQRLAPHHPRIDHSIFYNAFGINNANLLASMFSATPASFTPHAEPTQRIAFRLLSGDALPAFFSHNPFPVHGPDAGPPPAFMRASVFVYHPASLGEWWRSGARRFWHRQRVAIHMEPVTLATALPATPPATPPPQQQQQLYPYADEDANADPDASEGEGEGAARVAPALLLSEAGEGVMHLPPHFDREWVVPPEVYHPDALPAWKAHTPALAAHCDPSSHTHDSVALMCTGSDAADAWGGVAMPGDPDAAAELFWERFVDGCALPRDHRHHHDTLHDPKPHYATPLSVFVRRQQQQQQQRGGGGGGGVSSPTARLFTTTPTVSSATRRRRQFLRRRSFSRDGTPKLRSPDDDNEGRGDGHGDGSDDDAPDFHVEHAMAHCIAQVQRRFTHRERLQLELALNRLSTALLSRWTAVYYDTRAPETAGTTGAPRRSPSVELRKRLQVACEGHDSYFVLHLLSLFAVQQGRRAFEKALQHPTTSCFALASDPRFNLLSGAYLDMLLRPAMWRFHARKARLGRLVMNTKTPEAQGACEVGLWVATPSHHAHTQHGNTQHTQQQGCWLCVCWLVCAVVRLRAGCRVFVVLLGVCGGLVGMWCGLVA